MVERIEFQIDNGGETYACERAITGTRVLRQTIFVHGIGSKEDSANYGRGGHPVSSMTATARLIAHEIVREGGTRRR